MRSPDPYQAPPEGPDGPAEAAALAAARQGDRGAQAELLRRHFARIHALAFRLVGNPEDAEDLAQEGFVRAFRALALFRGQGSFEGWLRRIVVHLAQDRFRARGRREPGALPEDLAGGREPHGALEARELRLVLARALDALHPSLRAALLLRSREGLDYDEIAALTGVTPETARTRVMKARKELTRRLAPYLTEHTTPRAPVRRERQP
ncbi:MAG TPA: RNA polymerase sigma factor [Planctomycetota bacterium]